MDKFSTHTGVAAPLRRSDVDTDMIIPGDFLKRITRTGFEDGLFFGLFKDPGFVLAQEPYTASTILVAGPNFGTGSSREHAVWALQDFGFKVIISPRFGDIFRSNSGKSGLLTVQVEEEKVKELWDLLDAHVGLQVTVDLESREVRAGDWSAPFQIDDYTRWRFLEGLDDIGITLSHDEAIKAHEAARPSWKPAVL
ncbi:3-isopropylmalate dehydratase small subunit [Nocardioides daphniae]|uniref:3-isopropylmalate dehydratase small subunit n=1 Tax=Nocardioides daphniae TaxID=402297 RepID=A0A4V1CWD5_9ACTN|nr:3-isopropylmalate dehydratase small subunit [Nocardioides daphniae]QCC76887.1 3-isopropylmalate dehydratase small subunit [Nocardioides daphniae]GGD17388.1 3-isopropylmalate dehydratase small subunit [Nocardioides daphniae]